MKFEDLYIGQSYEMERTFSLEEVRLFAELSYDTNPLHTDADFAKNSIFGQQIVPGFLTASLFSAIIGTKFPGIGSIYLNQDMSFYKPVHPGQLVVAKVEVKELFPEKNRVLLATTCYNHDGAIYIDGTALIKISN